MGSGCDGHWPSQSYSHAQPVIAAFLGLHVAEACLGLNTAANADADHGFPQGPLSQMSVLLLTCGPAPQSPGCACRGTTVGAMWALDFCRCSGRAVYAGRDGQALVSSPHFLQRSRRRSPHSCFAGDFAAVAKIGRSSVTSK